MVSVRMGVVVVVSAVVGCVGDGSAGGSHPVVADATVSSSVLIEVIVEYSRVEDLAEATATARAGEKAVPSHFERRAA